MGEKGEEGGKAGGKGAIARVQTCEYVTSVPKVTLRNTSKDIGVDILFWITWGRARLSQLENKVQIGQSSHTVGPCDNLHLCPEGTKAFQSLSDGVMLSGVLSWSLDGC